MSEAELITMEEGSRNMSRKEKRKAAKREKRKQIRKELAEKARAELEARLNDPEEQRRIRLQEEIETERLHRERKEFEERERIFLEELATKQAHEEEEEELSKLNQAELENEANEDDDWEYVEEGPPEIIWQGNEIIVKKKRVRVKKKDADIETKKEDIDRPTSNPLPPQSEVFADYKNVPVVSAQQLLENVAQQVPNFGTEQDKAHCPFHIKTGACRFGSRCSRVHFYPDKSCTLLFKNMYNGPGFAWEQDEGLEYTDEEVERCYEEFYEDVHTELLKFGEIVNFKVCRNGSFHLRGNVYVHYKSLDSAVLAHHSINGRYFAGKQVSCEYVSVTKWKIAICGEYMKSRLKTCSRGTACNFIHCFRNPGGDYEWADWDKPPPKYWVRKMVALFGYSDESAHDKQMEQERDRYNSRRSRSKERDYLNKSSSRSRYEGHGVQKSTTQQRHARGGRKHLTTVEDETNSKTDPHGKNRTCDADSDGDWSDGGRNGNRYHDSASKSSRLNTKVTKSRECYRGTKRTHQSDSDRDLSDTDSDRDRDRHRHRHRHRNKVFEISDDFEESKNNRARLADAGGDWLDERESGRHYSDKRKSSRHWEKVSKSPKGYQDSTRSTRDSDSAEDWSDGDRERHHHRTRASSRTSNEVSELSDDHGESEKISNNKVHVRVSDLSKSEVQRVRTRNSSRRDRSSKETSEADFPDTSNSDRYGQRIKSHDLESRYDYDENIEKPDHRESDTEFLGKHKKSKRKLTPEENVEHGGSEIALPKPFMKINYLSNSESLLKKLFT